MKKIVKHLLAPTIATHRLVKAVVKTPFSLRGQVKSAKQGMSLRTEKEAAMQVSNELADYSESEISNQLAFMRRNFFLLFVFSIGIFAYSLTAVTALAFFMTVAIAMLMLIQALHISYAAWMAKTGRKRRPFEFIKAMIYQPEMIIP
ncbi:MAG: hypothetical protein JAY75_16370 [Candidatus Thiodiazotropha taylori]|nr:hypothetical protein [Candidatus Thiodiazotropha taylori]MCG8095359.1 hypothetical protein [Candidatus Thiodiazotropha endolucinida]MCG7881329.1 hypothetical protein [Candidatus Thiodiazotropha taylori]MCG7888533.1 hypothetical protein [Candidatus Thiodiazotropha taylori]MCG7892273.1 hypothetical protein [Candidatus Thiodiazotropha taylori]